MLEIGLIIKLSLISKLMTGQTRQQIIAIHIFPNISRRKCNQTIKFDKLIEKSYTKSCGEASPRLQKIKIEHISGSAVGNIIKFVFILCPSRGLPNYIKTKVLTTCFYFI